MKRDNNDDALLKNRKEYRTSRDVRTGYILRYDGSIRKVRYSVIDGLAILEGDIVLGTVDQMERRAEVFDRYGISIEELNSVAMKHRGPLEEFGVGIGGSQYRWAKRAISYCIGDASGLKSNISAAVQHWNSRTLMRIGAIPDSLCNIQIGISLVGVFFRIGDGCNSPVGYQNQNLQPITLNPNCADVGGVIHEIGHTVGLFHEHTRSDRDNFVTIQWNNIQDDAVHNFEIDPGSVNLGPYDYSSIMHYDAYAFTKNGQPTIITKPPGIPIGQRTGLSQGDIGAVATLYSMK